MPISAFFSCGRAHNPSDDRGGRVTCGRGREVGCKRDTGGRLRPSTVANSRGRAGWLRHVDQCSRIQGKMHAALLFSSGQAIEGIVDCPSERGSVAGRGCFVPDLKARLANPEGTNSKARHVHGICSSSAPSILVLQENTIVGGYPQPAPACPRLLRNQLLSRALQITLDFTLPARFIRAAPSREAHQTHPCRLRAQLCARCHGTAYYVCQ